MPTADEFFPSAARSSSYFENTQLHLPLSISLKIKMKFKNWTCSLYLIVPDTRGVTGWVAKGFHISGITGSHQQLHLQWPKRTKQKNENKTWIYLLSLFHSQTYLLISSSVSPLPAFYCLLKTAANFAQTTLQWRPQISAGRQAGYLSWVVA